MTPAQAKLLVKGGPQVVARTVVEAKVFKDNGWVSQSPYTHVVDVLEPFCIDVSLARK